MVIRRQLEIQSQRLYAIIAVEVTRLVQGKTPVDILLVPLLLL
ncbi:MAG: hypothetical protein ACLRQF_02975 [Thomasclavelia ramosa]